MKKILVVFDGAHFSMGAFDFARSLNDVEPVLLTGVFLPSIDYTNTMIYYIGGMEGPLYVPSVDTDTEAMAANIEKFRTLCLEHDIEYRVHDKISGSIPEGLKKETRYSDLLILSSELFYSNLGASSQHEYLHETMHHAECPVIILPEQYQFPRKVILTYDGSESSVFAIKQFAYMSLQLSVTDTVLVYASDKKDGFPDFDYIKEFAARHFPGLSFLKLDVDPKEYFKTWISDKGDALLVAGSHGRSFMSELFRKSFISELIGEHKLPVFIAHK